MAISRYGKTRGIDREPVLLTITSLTQDQPILIADGAQGNGDDAISQAIKQPTFYNGHASTALRVASTLGGLLDNGYTTVPFGDSRQLPGTWSQVWVLATGAAGGPCDMQAEGLHYGLPNDELGHPGFGAAGFELGNAGNETVTVTWTPQYDITISAINVYCLAQPASASGTFLLDGTANGNTLFSQYNLEGITADTLTAMTLTATTAQLNVDAGQSIVLTTTSNNADLSPGEVKASLTYTWR